MAHLRVRAGQGGEAAELHGALGAAHELLGRLLLEGEGQPWDGPDPRAGPHGPLGHGRPEVVRLHHLHSRGPDQQAGLPVETLSWSTCSFRVGPLDKLCCQARILFEGLI